MVLGETLYYTIIDASKYLDKEAKVLSWPTLFERLDKKVAEAGFSISSGITVSQDPYKNNSKAVYVRIDPDQRYSIESGQMLKLLKCEF